MAAALAASASRVVAVSVAAERMIRSSIERGRSPLSTLSALAVFPRTTNGSDNLRSGQRARDEQRVCPSHSEQIGGLPFATHEPQNR
jgi:hypothetical protein